MSNQEFPPFSSEEREANVAALLSSTAPSEMPLTRLVLRYEATVVALEAQLKAATDNRDALNAALSAEDEIKRLRNALIFYASGFQEGGQVARDALEGKVKDDWQPSAAAKYQTGRFKDTP